MRLLCSALLSANLLLGSSFSLLSPYHFLCQDNILPKNIFSFERTFVLSETPAESTPAADSSDVLNLSAPSVLLMEASTERFCMKIIPIQSSALQVSRKS